MRVLEDGQQDPGQNFETLPLDESASPVSVGDVHETPGNRAHSADIHATVPSGALSDLSLPVETALPGAMLALTEMDKAIEHHEDLALNAPLLGALNSPTASGCANASNVSVDCHPKTQELVTSPASWHRGCEAVVVAMRILVEVVMLSEWAQVAMAIVLLCVVSVSAWRYSQSRKESTQQPIKSRKEDVDFFIVRGRRAKSAPQTAR
uniref:Uncharacterized protein n=1 Tax=Noctiluca scintillans TaxID=2966 RepID=A0A7S1ASW2_NOCSC